MVTFYPASGYRNSGSGVFDNTGERGLYWNSAITGVNGYYFRLLSLEVYPFQNGSRGIGLGVRCVQYLLSLLDCVFFDLVYY